MVTTFRLNHTNAEIQQPGTMTTRYDKPCQNEVHREICRFVHGLSEVITFTSCDQGVPPINNSLIISMIITTNRSPSLHLSSSISSITRAYLAPLPYCITQAYITSFHFFKIDRMTEGKGVECLGYGRPQYSRHNNLKANQRSI